VRRAVLAAGQVVVVAVEAAVEAEAALEREPETKAAVR
jgi:hypothetical protein